MSQASAMSGSTGGGDDDDFTRTMVSTGNLMGANHMETVAKTYVKDTLFRHVKFVQPEDLDVHGVISKKLRKALNFDRASWPREWHGRYKKVTRKAINEKRNGVAQSIANKEATSKYSNIYYHASCHQNASQMSITISLALACLLKCFAIGTQESSTRRH